MNFNKIFVLGAGAIGSVYGAFLSKRNDVALIGNKAHVQAVNSKGLTISRDTTETFYVRADTEIHEIPQNTLIILTTKAYDSAKTVEKTKKLLKSDTIILILQNGLGNEEIVRHASGDEVTILRGTTTMAAEFFEPGKIRFWNGETIIEQNEVAKKITETFNACMLKTRLTVGIKKEVWNKLILNCVANPLSAIFNVKNHDIAADSLKAVRHNTVKECVEVGKAEGITFAEHLEERIDEQIATYTNFSSMYQDIVKGKRTEIDFLNGKVVELGRRHHITTPVNETLVCLTKFREERNGIPRKD